MFYIVSTPIGNLEDITYRAVRILSSCDYILCEDTRKSRILLNRYEIKKPLVSFHKFKEKKSEEKIIHDLKKGLDLCLISDAGTPLISDPGESILNRIKRENLDFTALPGACSVTAAFSLSGFPLPFQFIGFLPKKEKKRTDELKKCLNYEGSSIFFESPYRVLKTLEILNHLEPERTLCLNREMTKKFEECITDTPKKILKHFNNKQPKGEIVLIIGPKTKGKSS